MASIAALGLLAAVLVAHPPVATTSSCIEATLTNGWCRVCQVGFIAGADIKSKIFYETLDPHGHDVEFEAMPCPICRTAVKVDGFCEPHRVGYVAGRAYFSNLTYSLARGETTDARTLACPICRKNARRQPHDDDATGWCDVCNLGMVGNVAFNDRAHFEVAQEEFDKLVLSLRRLDRCELCAAASFFDTRCQICDITYKDGKPVENEGDSDTKAPGMEPQTPDA